MCVRACLRKYVAVTSCSNMKIKELRDIHSSECAVLFANTCKHTNTYYDALYVFGLVYTKTYVACYNQSHIRSFVFEHAYMPISNAIAFTLSLVVICFAGTHKHIHTRMRVYLWLMLCRYVTSLPLSSNSNTNTESIS